MTKQEHKLKSMLNYYEINLTGTKEEKMDKHDLKMFLNKFNQFMDYYILQEIIENIKNNREDKKEDSFDMFDNEDDEDDEPMLPKKENKKNKNKDKKNENDSEEFNLNDPISTDINKFLKWLTLVLYSGDHTVIITEDKDGIYIKLVKINKGKK